MCQATLLASAALAPSACPPLAASSALIPTAPLPSPRNADLGPVNTSCVSEFATSPFFQVDFLDFCCPRWLRLLAAETRFGLGITCSFSGFSLSALPVYTHCSRRTSFIALLSARNAASKSRESLSRRRSRGAITSRVTLRHPLCVRLKGSGEMGIPRCKPQLGFRCLCGSLSVHPARCTTSIGRVARPKHVAVPTNWASAAGKSAAAMATSGNGVRSVIILPKRITAPPNLPVNIFLDAHAPVNHVSSRTRFSLHLVHRRCV